MTAEHYLLQKALRLLKSWLDSLFSRLKALKQPSMVPDRMKINCRAARKDEGWRVRVRREKDYY